MGLNICAYAAPTLVRANPPYGAKRGEGETYLEPLMGFPHSTNLEPGFYRLGAELVEGRAGSYSGYSRWREHLSIMFLGTAPRPVWKQPEHYRGQPFYELINFSDCEGHFAGPAVVALAEAFNTPKHRARFVGRFDSAHMPAARTFDLFARVFQAAAPDGLVRFE